MPDGHDERLRDGLIALGVDEPDAVRTLARYIAEIELWNRRTNLVRAAGEELVVRHVLDSLSALPLLRSFGPRSVLDAGSGAGLPGIPLAACMPETVFTLLERSSRRAGFLRSTVALLGLRNTQVEQEDVERVAVVHDAVCARAFLPLRESFARLRALVSADGALIVYQGRRDVVEQKLAAVGDADGGWAWEVRAVRVPFLDEERHLVVFSRNQSIIRRDIVP